MDGFDTTQGMMLNNSVQQLINDVLVWVGFGTLVGLMSKGILPGRDPGGAIATVLMGIGGTVVGCGMASLISHGERVVPTGPLGMAVGFVGTLVFLFFFKLMSSHYFVEGEYVTRSHRQRRRYGDRRYSSAVYED